MRNCRDTRSNNLPLSLISLLLQELGKYSLSNVTPGTKVSPALYCYLLSHLTLLTPGHEGPQEAGAGHGGGPGLPADGAHVEAALQSLLHPLQIEKEI